MATLRTVQWWALVFGLGVSCSLNSAGFSGDGGPVADAVGSTGGAPATDAVVPAPGSGGASAPSDGGDAGIGPAGSGGSQATGGRTGSGGYSASGGDSGAGGSLATGGISASGSGGALLASGGAPSSGGAPGTGGTATGGAASGGRGQGGGASAAGGAAPGGAASGGAAGGATAMGGAGIAGRAGTGGRVGNCNRFPDADGFVPPGEDRVHCYWYRADTQTWPEARAQCQSETGGDLVTIRSEEENEFVRKLARFTNDPPEAWIGATDDRMGNNTMGPGTYRWVTGEAWATYTNWNQSSPRQPDGYCDPCNNGQPCTCDHRGTLASDGTWYDFWQEHARGYLCEAVAGN